MKSADGKKGYWWKPIIGGEISGWAFSSVLNKLEKNVPLYSHFSIRLSRRTSVERTRQLCASAKKRGGSLPLEAASYLVAYSGSDLNLLINELDKRLSLIHI